MNKSQIREAVARGWTHPATENLQMDSVLGEAIADEVEELFNKEGHKKYLGYCTNSQIIEELMVRIHMGDISPDYKTVDRDKPLVSR